MKRIIVSILSVILLLSACGKSNVAGESGQSEKYKTENNRTGGQTNSAEDETGGIRNWNKLGLSWNGKLGVYSAAEPKSLASGGKAVMMGTASNYFLLTFFDYKNLDSIVLCNKPDCKHDSDACGAYFSGKDVSKTNSFLFGLNGKIYFAVNGTVYAMNEDGTGRKKVIEIPSKYTAQSIDMTAFLVGDKVYLETNYLTDVKADKNGNLPTDDNGWRTVMFMLDVGAKTYKQLYEYKTQERSEFLGIIGDKAYYLYQDEYTKPKEFTQAEEDAQENGRKTRIFARDLGSGKRTDFFSGKSNEYDRVILRENYIFYQDRKDGEIVRYNPANGEKKALVGNLKSYIKFLPMDIENNKLFYIVDYYSTDFAHKTLTDNETYYVDIGTGKNAKITYRISRDDGKTDNFSGFTKVTGDYYILPVQYNIGKVSGGSGYVGYDYVKSTRYGKMKKQDFWNGKYTAQKIAWKGDQSLQ